jgi:hypothetical protein
MFVAAYHLIAALLLAPPPAVPAADQPPPFPGRETEEHWRRAEELARKGMQELLQSFEQFKQGLPVYGRPYIDEDGNIVIPRQRPPLAAPVPVPEAPPERL